ncbi:ABC transporter substrate-binding protein [Yersinia intermedia]|uniref:ABC transporter substrate-binding protein n=1 Tax=Yersinia intermedia TaxID=631 RepID=UPI0022FEC252|nr:ABC transporter substrate-binding protein [Yersinia intermedia]MDA5482170.1 ABC transporter substrate-binding protein [Yersinia intermedia]
MILNNKKILVGLVVTLFAVSSYATTLKSVAIVSIVDHPALDATRDGVIDELKAAGYDQNKVKIQFQSAQGNMATAGQIARKFIGDKPDAIVAISTPAAQSVIAATKSIPVVFTTVTDPVAAKLVKNWQPSGTNVTGVSDSVAIGPQVDLILKVKPDTKRVGMVYSPGEVNSTVVVKELKDELTKRGMTLVEVPAARTVDVTPAAKSLVGKVDVIYTNTDNNVISTYESLVGVANQAKIPLIAGDNSVAKRGAAAALGMSYYDLGRQTGKIVVRLLDGEQPGTIAPEVGNKLSLSVNPAAAEKQGVTLPVELVQSAQEVIK